MFPNSIPVPEAARPLGWDCQQSGCFNIKRRLKLEQLADCLPGKISFGDMDGYVEIGGHLCILEWKDTGHDKAIPAAQDIAFRKLTRDTGNVAFVVYGIAETMDVWAYDVYKQGERSDGNGAGMSYLKDHIKRWAEWAYAKPRVRRADVT